MAAVPILADWFREAVTAAFADRELTAYLGGLIDEDAAKAKQSALKAELADVEAQLAHQPAWDPRACEKALAVFNLSQKAGEIWQRSTSAEKRALLDAVCVNRSVGATSLVLEKR